MNYNSTRKYASLMANLSNTNTSETIKGKLKSYQNTIYEADLEEIYGEPMEVIGYYIVFASLCCIVAMGLDLVRGVMSRKLWFPIKYFALNAVTLTGITVAMKLTVDLSGSMPGNVDQVAKLGSMAFMCTMMANILPSLATMNNNELLINVIALGVLVITLVVNVLIQINSGVIGRIPDRKAVSRITNEVDYFADPLKVFADISYEIVAIIYVALLLLLLVTLISSSLAILKSKEIIEQKYKQCHKIASKDLPQSGELLTVEKLQQHVSKYWIMARSGSPQFISACSATATASGVICFLAFILHLLTIIWTIIMYAIRKEDTVRYDSAYKRSTLGIFIVQSIGVILGTVAPLFRCFSPTSYKLTKKSMSYLFKVEKYWTGKLYDWKYGSIALPLLSISLPFGHYKLKVVIRTLKNLILHFCIILQVVVVVVCKIIVLIIFFPTLCLKWLYQVVFSARIEKKEKYDIYVLKLENENEFTESTLKCHIKSVNRLIQKRGKKQPENLMNVIQKKSTKGFQGVKMFDNDDHKVEYQDCWSLLVVTLTTIVVTLPNIEKKDVESLLKSVREGLEYVTFVEETLINTNDRNYERTQKAAKKLWEEVDFRNKWLGSKLKDIASQLNTIASQVDTTRQIVQNFLDLAKNKVEGSGSLDDESKFTSICASSMSRISQTIINDQESHNKLFDELSSRIADIMAACLTNLPQAIAKKCHTSVVENREASVEAAAKLLGETKHIINTLQDKRHAYLNMTTDDLLSINKWCAHLSEP